LDYYRHLIIIYLYNHNILLLLTTLFKVRKYLLVASIISLAKCKNQVSWTLEIWSLLCLCRTTNLEPNI